MTGSKGTESADVDTSQRVRGEDHTLREGGMGGNTLQTWHECRERVVSLHSRDACRGPFEVSP